MSRNVTIVGFAAVLLASCGQVLESEVIEFEGANVGDCGDLADNDGDGLSDCDDADCADSIDCDNSTTTATTETVPAGEPDVDDDADGYTESEGDCDDSNGSINPSATEVCNNKDDDCNGVIDDSAADAEVWYVDDDGDNFGNAAISLYACTQPSGHVANAEDCDDQHVTAYPGAIEASWNGIDEDCDGLDFAAEACVTAAVADALSYVEYWSYNVADQSGPLYSGLVLWHMWDQILYVDGIGSDVEMGEGLSFSTNMETNVALNDTASPFSFSVQDSLGVVGSAECIGYMNWTNLDFAGDVELLVDGQTVTANVDMTPVWDGFIQDDLSLANNEGGFCNMSIVDTALGIAGYGDLFGFFETSTADVTQALANELEEEIAWYVNNNCSAQ